MKGFDIGQGLTCDLDRLVDTRLLVQANSGGGKSWCVRRLLEQTHGQVQQLVIDPEGEFASLRERFDYVLAARQGGDTAVDPRAAKLLAERLLELKVSAILDIYELKAHERIRFVRLFLEALVDAPKTLWHPALVVVDEAHVYCPEKGEAESAGPVIDLATRGRKRGFCAVLATQRLSKLHKDAAAECNNKLIGRTSLDIDMKRAGDELGMTTAEQRNQLRDLREGEFYAFGPAFGGRITRVIVGPVQTTHPKAGGRLAFTPPPPTSKITALLPKLADLPAEAEERQRSETDLRKEIATLKRKLTDAEKAHPAPKAETKTVEKTVLTAADREILQKLSERVEALRVYLTGEVERIVEKVRTATASAINTASGDMLRLLSGSTDDLDRRLSGVGIERVLGKLSQITPTTTQTTVQRPSPHVRGVAPDLAPATSTRPARVVSPSSGPGDSALPKGERATLIAVAQYPDGAARDQLSILTGYKRSTRDAYLQRLGEKGYIHANGNGITATQAGVDALGSAYEPLPTGAELLEWWFRRLPDGERKVLDVVAGCYPDVCDRSVIDDRTGFKRSTRDAYIQRLQARRLVVTERGGVQASAILFD